MTYLSKSASIGARDRILSVAAGLFAKYGYDGISTRDIAASTGVSEITVYRHYHSKRTLYCATLESELRKIHLRGDLLAHIAASPDMRTALKRSYELIESTLAQSPELLRLVQLSPLQLSPDVIPLLRRYLSQLIEVLAWYLKPWTDKSDRDDIQSRSIVLTLVSIVLSHQTLEVIFKNNTPIPDTMVAAYAELLEHQ